uniref:Uncharacterized protein n=1 Tax=Oryza punctata TaxID=4537 RepID=A0A0E0LER6_ORYPU
MCIFFEIPRTISNFITTLVAFLLLVLSLPSAAKRRSSGEPGARRGFPTRGLAVSNLRRLFYLYLGIPSMHGLRAPGLAVPPPRSPPYARVLPALSGNRGAAVRRAQATLCKELREDSQVSGTAKYIESILV